MRALSTKRTGPILKSGVLLGSFYFCLLTSASAQGLGPGPEGRIVHGRPAKVHEFPFIVALEEKGQKGAQCGASLISPSLVLTAAHCFHDPQGKVIPQAKFTLLAGEHDFAEKTGDEQRRKIKTLVIHEDYDWATNTNDVALLKVDKPFDLGDAVQPVRLSPRASGYSQKKCIVSGWGYMFRENSFKDEVEKNGFPDELQSADVDIIDKTLCKKLYKGKEEEASALHSTVVCAGHLSGLKDACVGDSGGPLVCNETGSSKAKGNAKKGDKGGGKGGGGGKGKSVLLVGIVSGGAGCALKNTPGLYTEVSKMYSWIQDTASKKLKEELDS